MSEFLKFELYPKSNGFIHVRPRDIAAFRQKPGYVELVLKADCKEPVNINVPETSEMARLIDMWESDRPPERSAFVRRDGQSED